MGQKSAEVVVLAGIRSGAQVMGSGVTNVAGKD